MKTATPKEIISALRVPGKVKVVALIGTGVAEWIYAEKTPLIAYFQTLDPKADTGLLIAEGDEPGVVYLDRPRAKE